MHCAIVLPKKVSPSSFLECAVCLQGANNIVTLEDDLMAAMVPRGYRMPANMLWKPSEELLQATRNLPWAQEACKGAASFNKVTNI